MEVVSGLSQEIKEIPFIFGLNMYNISLLTLGQKIGSIK
jgi:hypothetical protein